MCFQFLFTDFVSSLGIDAKELNWRLSNSLYGQYIAHREIVSSIGDNCLYLQFEKFLQKLTIFVFVYSIRRSKYRSPRNFLR